jgi:glutathione S-transferase
MKLFGAAQSPFVRKVRIALEEKGLSYDLEPPNPSLHPMGKMPVLRDGDEVIPDSSVICAYLERKCPTPGLYPADPAAFARALFVEEYADTQMAEGMGGLVFERFVKPRLLGQPSDPERVAALEGIAKERWMGAPRSAVGHPVPSVLDFLESILPNDRDTLLASFSIADIALGAHLGWLAFGGFELDAARWPRTARYQSRLAARPSFQATAS